MRHWKHQKTVFSLGSVNLLFKIATIGIIAMGCNGRVSFKQQAEDKSTQPGEPCTENCTPTPVDPPICDPWNPPESPTSGLIGQLRYLTAAQVQAGLGGAIADYFGQGRRVPGDIILSRLFAPTQLFSAGFPISNGQLAKREDGSVLYEYFGIHVKSQVRLVAGDPEGLYQFALISDDGSRLTVSDPIKRTLINSDKIQMSTFTVAQSPVMMRLGEGLPIEVRYFQGPAYHTSLILLWRPWNGSAADPADGLTGNEMFFDYNTTPPTPTQVSLDIVSRGWNVLKASNFVLPNGVVNPCE